MLNLHKITILLLLFISIMACGYSGLAATTNESWTLAKLISQGQEEKSIPVEVLVKNCVAPEQKSHSCAAGTSNSVSLSFGTELSGGGGVSAGALAELQAGVTSELGVDVGFDRSSGQELQLELPAKGYITRYVVTEKYVVNAGKVTIKSSNGQTKEGSFAFRASCELSIQEQETLPCGQSQTEDKSNSLTARDYFDKGLACNSKVGVA